jgi:hypothetical protein
VRDYINHVTWTNQCSLPIKSTHFYFGVVDTTVSTVSCASETQVQTPNPFSCYLKAWLHIPITVYRPFYHCQRTCSKYPTTNIWDLHILHFCTISWLKHAFLCSTSIKTNGNTIMKLKNCEKEKRIGDHERDIVNTTSEVLNEHATLKRKLKLFWSE